MASFSNCVRAITVVGLMTILSGSVVYALPPTVVVGVKSLQELIDDADFIGKAVGQDGISLQIESSINDLTGGAGLSGIDRDRPFGAYWSMSNSDPNDPGTFVAFLPVTEEEDFEKLVKKFVQDFQSKDHRWSLTVQGFPLFAKFSDGYCFVSNTESGLKDPSDPKKLIKGEYDIEFDLILSSIPENLKTVFLSSMEAEARARDSEDSATDSEAEAAGRKLGLEGTLSAFRTLTNDGDRLTLGIDIDSESRMTSLDVEISSLANTALARALGVYSATTPAFGAVAPESAPLRLVLSHPTVGMIDQLNEVCDAIRKSAGEEIDRDPKMKDDADKKAARDVANRLLDIIQGTIKSGALHSILVLDEGDNDTVRIIAGTKVSDGKSAGKLLDDILKLAEESPELAKVKQDVAKISGARVHAIVAEAHDKQAEMFGDDPIHFAIHPNSLWFAIGGGNLELLKTALSDSMKAVPKTEPPISLRTKPATLVTLLETDNKELIERAESIAGQDGDVLNFEIVPNGRNSVKIRLEFGVDLFLLGRGD